MANNYEKNKYGKGKKKQMIKNRDANDELNKAKDCIDKAIQLLQDEYFDDMKDEKVNTSNIKKLDAIIIKIEKLQNC